MRRFFRLHPRSHDVPAGVSPSQPYANLARNLEALASETRLALLHVLRTPRALSDIRVAPSLTRAGENPQRALSRQAVTHQLESLLEAGLVLRTSAEDRARGDLFVLNHERLFALVDEMRSLVKLRPALVSGEVSDTMARASAEGWVLPPGPRLLVVYGRDDGTAFPLQGPEGTRWRVGRAPGSEVRLDYDPYLSAEHAAVERSSAGYAVRDLGSRNGTWLNGGRLAPNASKPLCPGDVLTFGRSHLVFQAPPG